MTWGNTVGISQDGQYVFPDSPGVYAFAEVVNGEFEVRYVGRSSNLQERISDHLQNSENSCLRDMFENAANVKIRATVQHSERRRMDIEHTCYIHYHKHGHNLCNTAKPRGNFLNSMKLPF